MMELFDLSNRTAVVTGGYGHLGTAISLALAAQGATVIVAGRSEKKYYEKFGEEDTGSIYFRPCDITDSSSVSALFRNVKSEFGSVDILVNNAATASGNSPDKMSDDDWNFSMDAVAGSVHRCIREVIPYMREQKAGKIINIASMYGMVSPDFRLYEGTECEKFLNPPHYGAAKAAILQVSRYYASYLGKDNIHVNTVTPGPFPSVPIQNAHPQFIERLKAKNPLGKIGRPEDLAGICMLLSSSASDFITGQNFVVDGGWTII
jgi:NAD(P)-dependent dehydrogenase (short-subunit alcohol dehydrogenase family)